MRDVFEALREGRGRIALATDCRGPELNNYRSLLNVDDLIDAMACGDDVEHGKPDPTISRAGAWKARDLSRASRHHRRHSV